MVFVDFAVVIGFSQTEYSVDEDAGTVELFVSVLDGAIPAGETRVVMLTTNDGTAQGRRTNCLYLKILVKIFSQLFHQLLMTTLQLSVDL